MEGLKVISLGLGQQSTALYLMSSTGKIRNTTKTGIKQPIYLHRSCIPLDEVDLKEGQQDLFFFQNAKECVVSDNGMLLLSD